MKDKLKKIFKVVRIVAVVLIIVGITFSIIVNVQMHKILEAEEADNIEFFQLKVAIAQCYLTGKGGLIGNNEGLYQDYLYSKKCESSLNTAKWLASRMEIQGQIFDYKGEVNLLFKKKLLVRIDSAELQQIIDNDEKNEKGFVIGEENIDAIMHYDNSERIFIVEFDNE